MYQHLIHCSSQSSSSALQYSKAFGLMEGSVSLQSSPLLLSIGTVPIGGSQAKMVLQISNHRHPSHSTKWRTLWCIDSNPHQHLHCNCHLLRCRTLGHCVRIVWRTITRYFNRIQWLIVRTSIQYICPITKAVSIGIHKVGR